MSKPKTSLSALIKRSSSADKPSASLTKTPLRSPAHVPLPGPTPKKKLSTGTLKTTMVYYQWDLDRIEEAQKFLRATGRKAERSLTVRALIHHGVLDEGFVKRYDDAEKLDARRGIQDGGAGEA